MTVRSDFTESNPNVVKTFKEAWYKAVAFCEGNLDDENKIMEEGLGLELQDIIEEGWTFFLKRRKFRIFR